jgi:hypothetical protein
MNKNGEDTEVATSMVTTGTRRDPEEPETASGTKQSDIHDQTGGATTADDSVAEEAPPKRNADGPRISISVRTLAVGAVIVGLITAVGTITWLYLGVNTRFDDQTQQIANNKHAEQIAVDYAVNAAIMDFKDLGPWKQNLVKGTTPELNDKLTKAGNAMEQILLPLQWSSEARPLAAKVRSSGNGIYVVDAFVSVMTKTVQAAASLQSTATYGITIDSKNAWKITDVGGIAAVVDSK